MASRMSDDADSGSTFSSHMHPVLPHEENVAWIRRKLRLSKLSVFTEPQSLIVTGEDGHLQVQDHILKEIETIDVPLSVVAIAGSYRTGKSYIMNQIAGKPQGFSVGNTVQRHTKGIWVWCVIHPIKERHVLLLLDTEGLSDPTKGDNEFDQKIFCLVVLMCSTLIYNVQGVVGAETIQKLALVKTLPSSIQCFKDTEPGKHDNEEMIHQMAPIFVLCLRDFYLKLEDDGKPISADEYFESLLRGEDNEKSGQNNEIKECIRQYFSRRKCYTIDIPVHPKQLQELQSLTEDDLDKAFIKNINQFKEYIYECEPNYLFPELSTRQPVNGLDDISGGFIEADLEKENSEGNCLEGVLAIEKEKLAVMRETLALQREALELKKLKYTTSSFLDGF